MPFVLGIGAVLVLGAGILFVSLHVRQNVREQIVGRDAEILKALSDIQPRLQAQSASAGWDTEAEQLDNLLQLVLHLDGVIGARLYSASGEFNEAIPGYVGVGEIASGDLSALRRLAPISRFHQHGSQNEAFLNTTSGESNMPLLEIFLPLHDRNDAQLVGVAQLILNGDSIAAEFAALDTQLAMQGLVIFFVGGLMLAPSLTWAVRRLQLTNSRLSLANKQLNDRSESLIAANAELAQLAKTSAVGSIAFHLVHGLKSPLFGLSGIVSALGERSENAADSAIWNAAIESTRNMQNTINRVVEVMQQGESFSGPEIPLEELEKTISYNVATYAMERGVGYTAHCDTPVKISSKTGSILHLILENLLHNAIEASEKGITVALEFGIRASQITVSVSDQGGGLPDYIRNNLFVPCKSQKSKGSGIGLTISKQLAQHIGAELELTSSSERGSVFTLSFPLADIATKPDAAIPASSTAPLSHTIDL